MMQEKISLLLPTYGRVPLAQRFMQSVVDQTTHLDNVEIIIRVDEDDIESHQLNFDGLNTKLLIGKKTTMGNYNTECFNQSSGEIVVLVNDDMVIQTQGWDEKLRALHRKIEDKIYLAYCNDLFKKGDLCTFPILSRQCCELLQQPYHSAYKGAFIDYHLMDIFKRLERSGVNRIYYLDDVVFEHLHYRTGKVEIDVTYRARGRFDDDMIFISLKDVRETSYAILLNAINGSQSNLTKLPIVNILNKFSNPFMTFWLFTKIFLLDSQLPFKWRFFMWWWFSARYVASYIL